jgi:hypothetical protein
MFHGMLVEVQRFGIRIEFASAHNNEKWTLVCVYGPCHGVLRDQFVSWLYNLAIPCSDNWILLGDFNFIRSQDNRNKPGGDMNEMFLFNDIIGHLGLLELPLKARRYTWSNMQREPLLEQLDWFFTSQHWISDYPNTMVLPLEKRDLIMYLVWSILTLLYPRQRYLGLRIIGWIFLGLKNVLLSLGREAQLNCIAQQ